MPNEVAPEGSLYVCMACGKTSKDWYGFQAISPGWDESCTLNCDLVPMNRLVVNTDGRVVSIKSEDPV